MILLVICVLFVLLVFLLISLNNKKKRLIIQKKDEIELEKVKIFQEKKCELETIYNNVLSTGTVETVLDTGRNYYSFINGGILPPEIEKNIVHDMKERRRYFGLDKELTDACIRGDLEYIKKNIDVEYDINKTCDSDGLTLLCLAVKNNYYNIVKWLVENGANVNCTLQSPVDYNDRESLLVWCTDRRNCDNNEIIRYIIENGAVKKY